jgi:hypothetical protein
LLERSHLAHLITCILAVYVGVRTLRLWRRTRMIPELSIGVSVLSLAIGGVVFAALGTMKAEHGGELLRGPVLVGIVALTVHLISCYAGTWQVYRAKTGWATGLFAAGSLLAVAWAGLAMTASSTIWWLPLMLLLLRGGGMLWAATEAFRYSMMLRRRVSLGLAEPMVARRIWLWGVGAGAQTFVIAIVIGCQALHGAALADYTAGVYAMASFGLMGSIAVAFAFFPPRWYIDAIESRASLPIVAEGA